MSTEPVCVYYSITAPNGAVLESGEGTIGEVDAIRETLTQSFPRCTLHLMFPPRMVHAPEMFCGECDQPAHCNDRKDHRCACPDCIEGRKEFLWEREYGI